MTTDSTHTPAEPIKIEDVNDFAGFCQFVRENFGATPAAAAEIAQPAVPEPAGPWIGDPQNPPIEPSCCGGQDGCDVREYCATQAQPATLDPIEEAYFRGINEGLRTAAEAAEVEERMKSPPCVECGAMTEEEAGTKCRCAGDKDDCHGCRLWPDPAPATNAEVLTDERVELAAKAIFEHWEFGAPVAWVEYGNSEMQDRARRFARAAIATQAAQQQPSAPQVVEPARCIKPQCPPQCAGCEHAIPSNNEALVLIADLLDAFANDGHGAPFEDGESALTDRARAYLCRATREPTAAQASTPVMDLDAAKRLRRVCNAVGLGNAVPADDARLWSVAFSVLGMVDRAVEKLQQPAQVSAPSVQVVEKRRLDWLHSPASNNVDGYEWGIFRVKWVNGQAAEVWQTNSDFSDLDAAIRRSCPACHGTGVIQTSDSSGLVDQMGCDLCGDDDA